MSGLAYWHWWLLAILLAGLEVFAPGFVFVWFAASAGVTGLLLLAWPTLAWQLQLTAFGALAVLAVLAWLRLRARLETPSDRPNLNRRAEQLVGQTVTLASAIENGRGRARIGDGWWSVQGPELPAGSRVRITGHDGAILRVEAAAEPAPATASPANPG